MKKRCFHGIILCFLFYSCAAQDNLLFKTFSFAQGLSTYNIYKARQDAYGFIWVCTQDGLFRFNGNSFEVIKNNTGNPNPTMGNVFLNMEIGGDNNIYAADYYYGIDIIDAANLRVNYIGGSRDKEKNILPNYWIEKIYTDTRLNLWVGGKGYIAFKKKSDTSFTTLTHLPGLESEIKVKFIKVIAQNTVAISVENYGILLYDMNTLTRLRVIRTASNEFSNKTINDICLKGDTVFAITNTAVIKGTMKGNLWYPVAVYSPAVMQNLITTCITADKKGNLWIGTNSGIICYNVNSGKSLTYKADKKRSNWLKDNFINDLFIDNQDNLWVSTFNVLQMASLRENQFRSYSGDKAGSDYMEHIYSIVQKNKNEIFCTGVDGLYVTELETGVTKKIPGTGNLGLIHHIEKIEDNFWILSTDAGMYAYEPAKQLISQSRLLQRFPEWNTYRANYFNTAFTKDGVSYWASEEREGLVKWDMKNHLITKFKAGTAITAGLTENHIRNIKADQDGFIWILSDATMSRFNMAKDTVEEVLYFNNNSNTPDASLYFDMYDDGKILWFASYGAGICGYYKKEKKWTFISEENGLCNNSVYGILPQNDSIFWVSTNMGLSKVNHYTKNCSNYFYEDGLQDNSFDEKGALALGNKLLFGGINGFTTVNLNNRPQSNSAFPVYIQKVEYYADNKKFTLRRLNWDKIDLPKETNSIEIFLCALAFTENHKIKFSYRIEGINKEFVKAGPNNSIVLNALDYGTYKVTIRCNKPDGTYLENVITLSLFIEPRWYQTWWFKLAVLLLLCGIAYAFYRYRIGQIKKQHEIRKNIAADLHDDLGSTLNSVKIFTNLALSGVKKEESLLQAKHNLTEATMSLRDMIWVLDDALDTAGQLAARIQQYTLPVASASNINAAIKINPDYTSCKLSKEEKRNLFLICKEAINNSIKYSGASEINITITGSGKKIQITIADNGKGFNADAVEKGYGLKNIQYRAAQIKYTAVVIAAPGEGTQISIHPLL